MTVRDTRPEPIEGSEVDRFIHTKGSCPDCAALYGNYHDAGCLYGGIVGSARIRHARPSSTWPREPNLGGRR